MIAPAAGSRASHSSASANWSSGSPPSAAAVDATSVSTSASDSKATPVARAGPMIASRMPSGESGLRK